LKDIREKPVMKEPRTLEKASRMPRELFRRGVDDARERLTEQARDAVGTSDTPESYGAEKITGAADEAVLRAERAGENIGRRIGKRVKILSKRNESSPRNNPVETTVKKQAPSDSQAYRGGRQYARRTTQARQADNAKKAVYKTKNASGKSVKTIKRGVKTANSTVKTTEKSIKTAEKAAKASAKAAKATAKTAAKVAKVAAQAAFRLTKLTVKAAVTAVKAIIAAVKGLTAAIAAGGWVVLVVILVIGAIAALLLSPFGILTGGGADGTPTITEAVQMINGELYEKVDAIQSGAGDVAEVRLLYNNSAAAAYVDNWADVLAVFAVRANMDEQNPMDVVVMDDARMALLQETFWDMTSVSHVIEERKAEPTGTGEDSGNGETETERILIIHINSKSFRDMISVYNFNAEQTKMLEEMMSPDMRKLLQDLTGSDACLRLSSEKIAEIMKTLPADLIPQRLKVVLTAYSLVGKVHYFWGGKSTAIGWDTRWGLPRVVTSGGSPTTGTIRPFGLDCSGYVSWVFINAAGTADALETIGNGSSNQWNKCKAVSWDDALPGDVAWLYVPGSEDVNHVGVVVGTDADGDLLVAHCSSSRNNVVVTKARDSGFRYIRRPTAFYIDE